MSNLDTRFGNANGPKVEAYFRMVHKRPPTSGEYIHFTFYMEAPLVVDWLEQRGITAHYEQRKNEGISIVTPNHRAFVGNYILLSEDQIRII